MALQLRDALRPYLPAAPRVRVVGLTGAAADDLVRHLQLLDGAEVTAVAEGAAPVGATPGGPPPVVPGTLTVLGWPVGDASAGDRVAAALAEAEPGTALAVALDRGPLDAPWPQLLDVTVAAGGQVLDAVPVAGDWPLLVLVTGGAALVPPARYLAGPDGMLPPAPAGGLSDSERRTARRLAGELVFTSLRERQLTAELAAVRAEADVLRTQPPPQGELEAARSEAAAARARLARLESSSALRLGRALASARSARGALRLPVEVAALARQRSGARPGSGGGSGSGSASRGTGGGRA
ncbi:hypothetical protein [Motilibacter aurantiacus]|uniref:hypothetical protein n=1 Tax=Motilibacter aurantiacus TaxID=2714955 RepID=UPI00140AF888|nr:hypothetical protein [Motilibacter aurantiacus]NHC43838.1 hypothetical protein [Motilibacter aurantiacus]